MDLPAAPTSPMVMCLQAAITFPKMSLDVGRSSTHECLWLAYRGDLRGCSVHPLWNHLYCAHSGLLLKLWMVTAQTDSEHITLHILFLTPYCRCVQFCSSVWWSQQLNNDTNNRLLQLSCFQTVAVTVSLLRVNFPTRRAETKHIKTHTLGNLPPRVGTVI